LFSTEYVAATKATLLLTAHFLGFAICAPGQKPSNTSPNANASKQIQSTWLTADATNPGDKTVRVWDVRTGNEVEAAYFSPDGKLIITNRDKTFQIWDVPAGKPLNHLGAWQLVSFKYGDTDKWSEVPPGEKRIKLITGTRFTWIAYETVSGKVKSIAGGPFTLSGSSCTQTIEYAGEGMADYLGKKQSFTIQLERDELHQSGQLSDGTKMEEIWQRIK